MSRIYLASPYSHKDPMVRQERVELAEAKAIELMKASNDNMVFSPVVYGHRLEIRGLHYGDASWRNWSMSFLMNWAEVLVIYTLDGWRESMGVIREHNYAEEKGMPIIYL